MSNSNSAFRSVVALLHKRIRRIDTALIKALWGHAIKFLVEYLVLKPL